MMLPLAFFIAKFNIYNGQIFNPSFLCSKRNTHYHQNYCFTDLFLGLWWVTWFFFLNFFDNIYDKLLNRQCDLDVKWACVRYQICIEAQQVDEWHVKINYNIFKLFKFFINIMIILYGMRVIFKYRFHVFRFIWSIHIYISPAWN